MTRKHTLLLILTAAFAPCLSAGQAKRPVQELNPAAGANAIAFKFYAKEAAVPGNLFFSPYSLYTAFAMTYEGAKGKTAKEIASVFAFPSDRPKLRSGLAKLGKELAQAAQGTDLTQVNALWAQEEYRFLPAYIGVLHNNYDAEARPANFKTAAEVSRREINLWTEEHTKGKIAGLLKEGSLTPLTRLVLVNAVYFKGKWAWPFSKEMTGAADFTRTDGQKVKARMMGFNGTRDLEYGETKDFQTVRLPYSGGGLAMLVALPKAGVKLSDAEKKLTAGGIDEIRKSLVEQKVKVFLPKFSFSSGFELNATLSALGMPAAFTDAADFSGMDGTHNLYIQQAVHKAFIDVGEEGTEAAAASAAAMGMKSASIGFALLRADRPFFFLIENPENGLILFMGRLENPLD